MQRGRLADWRQLETPATGATPASFVIQDPLDQARSLLRIDGQTLLDPYVVTDQCPGRGRRSDRLVCRLVDPRPTSRDLHLLQTLGLAFCLQLGGLDAGILLSRGVDAH